MSSEPTPPPNNLLIQPSLGLAPIAESTSPVLSEIIKRSLIHVQTSKTLGNLRRIGDHELQSPDYQLVCSWAEQLGMTPAAVLIDLFEFKAGQHKTVGTTLVDGSFINLVAGPKLRKIRSLSKIEGLKIEKLLFIFFDRNDPFVKGELTDLDLTSVPSLTQLTCLYNQLTKLELASVPNLLALDFGFNQLTNLDLSQVPNLLALNCKRNHLSNLNLSQVANLTELDCSENYLTELDLSQVPNLTRLSCQGNPLTELDIRPIERLKTLYSNSIRLIQRPDQNFK